MDNYCTNCGADLDEQWGFDSSADYWYCKECGQLLVNPDDDDDADKRFSNVSWICDGCLSSCSRICIGFYMFSIGFSGF